MNRKLICSGVLSALCLFVSACGSDGSASISGYSKDGSGSRECDGTCSNENLSSADVTLIVRQASTAATSLGVSATFAVLDRTGNVLALYSMPGAPTTTTINGQIGAAGGLEGLTVPATLAAISKAGTGAYLSSQGNAFTSRTAGQIIQQNFLPGENNKPGGPLFGVQFSQLLCSDITVLNPQFSGGNTGGKTAAVGLVGPRPLPLGLSADPGGLPLYKNGDLVGGIGVEFNGLYTIDTNIGDFDINTEEQIALAASTGFEAPSDKKADNIFVGGRSLRFADSDYGQIPLAAESLDVLDPAGFVSQQFYTDGTVRDGAVFGTAASGVAATARAGIPAAVLVNGSGGPRFPSHAGRSQGGLELQASEVEALLDSGLTTAQRSRAAIRNPLDTPVRVSIFIVDVDGNPLGFIRSQDAPVFGIDVSLQKARATAFLSSPDAGARLSQAAGQFGYDYSAAYTTFTGGQSLDGSYAFSARGIGNIARPFFLDGINGNSNGPLSLPFPGLAPGRSWSVFNTGLQLDLVFGGLAAPLGSPAAVPNGCANSGIFGQRLANGMQIFAGGVPLYRNGVLIGAFGVSGDGIDQDDMTAFLGSSRVGLDYAGHTGVGDPVLGFNAPSDIRSDKINLPIRDTSLRYVNCPEAPFSGSNEQNACEGQ